MASRVALGMDYKTFNACRQRELDGELAGAKKSFGKFFVDKAIDGAFMFAKTFCKPIPAIVAAPLGGGVKIPVGDTCGGVVDNIEWGVNSMKDLIMNKMKV